MFKYTICNSHVICSLDRASWNCVSVILRGIAPRSTVTPLYLSTVPSRLGKNRLQRLRQWRHREPWSSRSLPRIFNMMVLKLKFIIIIKWRKTNQFLTIYIHDILKDWSTLILLVFENERTQVTCKSCEVQRSSQRFKQDWVTRSFVAIARGFLTRAVQSCKTWDSNSPSITESTI